jgi:hypothetical protein
MLEQFSEGLHCLKELHLGLNCSKLFQQPPRPETNIINGCDIWGCYHVEETAGCMCNDPVTDESSEFFGLQVACTAEDDPDDIKAQPCMDAGVDSPCLNPLAPESCESEHRMWFWREGCYDTNPGDIPGCSEDPEVPCCFFLTVVNADVYSREKMSCRTVDFRDAITGALSAAQCSSDGLKQPRPGLNCSELFSR